MRLLFSPVCRTLVMPATQPNTAATSRVKRLLWVLLCVILLVLAYFGSGYWYHRRLLVAHADDPRLWPEVALPPGPLPTELPLLGPEGRDADGYPLRYIDMGAVRSLLLNRRFKQLTAYIETLEDRFERDYTTEYWLYDASVALQAANAAAQALVDEWVAASPKSFAPYLVRASVRSHAASALRGGGVYSDVSSSDIASMEHYSELAMSDCDRAIKMRPKAILPLMIKLDMLGTTGSDDKKAEVARRGMAVCPKCYLFRAQYMAFMAPNWGGSYDEMREFSRESSTLGNPRLRYLGTQEPKLRGFEASRLKDPKRTMAFYDQALSYAPEQIVLINRTYLKMRSNDLRGALADAELAHRLRPGLSEPFYMQALLLYKLHRLDDAVAMLLAGRATGMSPDRSTNDDIAKALGQQSILKQLRGDRQGALADILTATELMPASMPLVVQRNKLLLYGSTPQNLPRLIQAAKSEPDDFITQLRAGTALILLHHDEAAEKFWTAYLAKHPKAGAAYAERAFIRYGPGKFDASKQDGAKACLLGSSRGCFMATVVPRQ